MIEGGRLALLDTLITLLYRKVSPLRHGRGGGDLGGRLLHPARLCRAAHQDHVAECAEVMTSPTPGSSRSSPASCCSSSSCSGQGFAALRRNGVDRSRRARCSTLAAGLVSGRAGMVQFRSGLGRRPLAAYFVNSLVVAGGATPFQCGRHPGRLRARPLPLSSSAASCSSIS